MRVVRIILGILMLVVGVPVLLVGGLLATALQHRDPGGAFTGTLQEVPAHGYAVLVPDVERLLRDDAPLALRGDTRLRITADTASGPAFVGIAPAAEAARYLAGVPHTRVDGLELSTGALPLHLTRVPGAAAPGNLPVRQSFWLRSGTGALEWRPDELRNNDIALVIMQPTARPGMILRASAEVRPGGLDLAAWGLLVLGTVLVTLGVLVLAWPGRRREIVYVVEPSQVPALAARLGSPLLALGAATDHAPGPRPASLAESPAVPTAARPLATPPPAPPALPALPLPALPQPSWSWPPLPREGHETGTATPTAAHPAPAVPRTTAPLPPLAGRGSRRPAPRSEAADASGTTRPSSSGPGGAESPTEEPAGFRAAPAWPSGVEPGVVGRAVAESPLTGSALALTSPAEEDDPGQPDGERSTPADDDASTHEAPARPRRAAVPAASGPAAAVPAASGPAAAMPATSRPAAAMPATSRPAAGVPAASGPAAAMPATSRPAAAPPAVSGAAAAVLTASGPAAAVPAASGAASARSAVAAEEARGDRVPAGLGDLTGLSGDLGGTARARRRKTAGGLPLGDPPPVEQMKTTRPIRTRPTNRGPGKPADGGVKPTG